MEPEEGYLGSLLGAVQSRASMDLDEPCLDPMLGPSELYLDVLLGDVGSIAMMELESYLDTGRGKQSGRHTA
ncbi:hypothetical protein JDV02_009556 [Purpureocillium takamizusanense]|uniref:Uncharacterized protein n=1 Tax=Purpureocillium takamizusanense TaxID=2060973 RepID=A0A9Q8QPZ3_9HYPO|nr:uncharacterized protein JDV02_009556 [Purpureocillium takamizusanense]UNI23755.1 hypothetical protein JDV02_009556 [Purpureocillium takamizusanense]